LKKLSKYVFLGLLSFFVLTNTFAQSEVISVYAENEPLSEVLSRISENYKLKFAFDSDSFQEISVTTEVENVSLTDFLQLLNSQYNIKSKLIDGTWVMLETQPEVIEIAPPKKTIPKYVEVSGFVKDKSTGKELMYCNLALGENKGGMTNELGFFNIEVPKTDSVKLKISYLGYRPIDTLVAVDKEVTIYLQTSGFIIDAIEVRRYEKQILQSSPQTGKIAFNPAKSENTPRVSNDDLANALLFIPGVNFLQGNVAGLSVRGATPTDNLILFDGIPVLETSHLLGNMSVLNSKFVQQAFVSRGGFGAEFGDRVAGLIELTGKSGKNRKPYLELGANLLNTNVLINFPIGHKFSLTAAWRRSFIDSWENYLYLRLVEGVNTDNTSGEPLTSSIYPVIQYEDVNAKISFHPSDNFDVNLNFLYGRDNQSKDFALLQTNDFFRNEGARSEHLGFSFNLNWQSNNKWFHSFKAGFSSLEKFTIDEMGELKEYTEIIENPGQGKGKGKGLLKTKEKTYEKFAEDIDNGENRIEEYRISWKSEFKTGSFFNKAGIGWTANDYSYNFYANRSEAFVPVDAMVDSASLYMLNAFIHQDISVTEKLNFYWGVRSNLDITSGKTYWQPRGGLEYQPEPGLSLYVKTGIYNQFLTGLKRIDSEGRFNRIWYLTGNKDHDAVRSKHYIFGAEYEKNGWFLNIEGYVKNTSGKINFLAETVDIGNKLVISYFPQHLYERNTGIDFFVQKKHSIFNHMLGYSLSNTDERTDGINSGSWYSSYTDRPHRLKISEILSWKNWSITGSWQFASGLPVLNLSEKNELINPERTLHFSQLDFAVAKKLTFPHFSVHAGASFLNVLDRINVVEVNYLRFASAQETLSVRSDISALGFTPVFFVNIELR